MIEDRNRLLNRLCDLTGLSWSVWEKRLQDATEDCCGAYRHSWEVGWLKHELSKVEGLS